MKLLIDENMSSPRLASRLKGTIQYLPATLDCFQRPMRECFDSRFPKPCLY